MSNEFLLQKESGHPSDEDSDGAASFPSHRYLSQKPVSVAILILLGLSSTTLILVLLQLLLLAMRGNQQCPAQESSWNMSMFYPDVNASQMGLDHEHDEMWSAFEPSTGFGLIYKENPDTAGMISMFHQMQCLAVFRQALQVQHDGQTAGLGEREVPYALHCLNYMYQTVRCSADDTIEWEIPTIPRTKRITGMDTPRMCRDASKLVKQACDAREVYIRNGWKDPPLPTVCDRGEMPW